MEPLQDRAPQLFETLARDEGGRPMDDPKHQGQLLSLGPRIPSPVEVVNFVLSEHHVIPDAPTAIDIVDSLNQLSKLTAAASKPAAVPPPPPPAEPPKTV